MNALPATTMNTLPATAEITCSITAPSLEAAVSSLCEKVFGAKLHIEAPPEERSEAFKKLNAMLPQLRSPLLADNAYLTEQRDRYMRCSQNIEKQNVELEMKWHGAVADASELRNEVERLADQVRTLESQRDNTESYIEKEHIASWRKIQKALPPRPAGSELSLCDYVIEQLQKPNADLFAYGEFTRNVATALGMGTHEISFADAIEKIGLIVQSRSNFMEAWAAATKTAAEVIGERDRLKASLAETTDAWNKDHMEMKRKLDAAIVPRYRMLDVGETLIPGDEMRLPGGSAWVPIAHVVTTNPLVGEWCCMFRRKITPA